MSRRDALSALAVLAAGLLFPPQAVAQLRRVGVVWFSGPGSDSELAFLAAMKELGYVPGTNVVIDARHANGDPAKVPALVSELLALQPDVLLGASTITALEMKTRTSTVPIVTGTTGDPVGSGLVKSLRKPGGNVTGVALLIHELGSKHVEMASELLPGMKQIAVLTDLASEKSIREKYERLAALAAKGKSMSLTSLRIKSAGEVHEAMRKLETRRADVLLINPTPRFNAMRRDICAAATRIGLPIIGFSDEWAADGALMSYGPDFGEALRLAARYVNRILKGDRPADLPVQQPTRFSLAVNAKIAKALAVSVPGSILVRADRVIE